MNETETSRRLARISGTLFGTAIGDALGFYVEGMRGEVIAKRYGKIEAYMMPGGKGVLSDDTEQSALVAESLALYPDDVAAFEKHLRRGLVKWFWTFPPGVGAATAKACLRMTIGLSDSGIKSAGNGAAMRAAIIGTYFSDDSSARKKFGTCAAATTHADPRAIEGALFVAELAAACTKAKEGTPHSTPFAEALATVVNSELLQVLNQAQMAADSQMTVNDAAYELGTSGFVVHTLGFSSFCFLRFGADPAAAIREAVSAGGDTDSIGAIVGAWMGALRGKDALPQNLLDNITQGPIDLQSLSQALASGSGDIRGFSYLRGLAHNAVLVPTVLILAIWRLFF